MGRRLFASAAVASALPGAAACVLWVRGYVVEDRVYARHGLRYVNLASYRGEVRCELGTVYSGGPPDLYTPTTLARYRHIPVSSVPESDYVHIAEAEGRFAHLPHYHDVMGFRWHPRSDHDWEYRERGVAVPCWFVVLTAGLLPALWMRRHTGRSSARMKGGCHRRVRERCGGAGRRPECGRAPEGIP